MSRRRPSSKSISFFETLLRDRNFYDKLIKVNNVNVVDNYLVLFNFIVWSYSKLEWSASHVDEGKPEIRCKYEKSKEPQNDYLLIKIKKIRNDWINKNKMQTEKWYYH